MDTYLEQAATPRKPISLNRIQHGVTLIDLVICVMVMGILAAVGVPKFASAVSRLRCEAVAKRVASDLNFARRVAIQSSRTATVAFRSNPAGYDMTGVANPANATIQYSVNLSDVDSSIALVAFSFNGGSSLAFNNYGRPMVGPTAMVSGGVTVRSGEHSFNVIVTATTGEVLVQ